MMSQEPILQYVVRKLAEHKGQHKEIAYLSGVRYTTLRNISQGVTPNPGVQSIQALADYFRSKE